MTNCKEYILDDLMAITAIPVADIDAGDPLSPVNQFAPVIDSTGFNPTITHAVVIGRQPATANGTLIPISRNTGKAKDTESDSVAGRLHTVTVTCETDDRAGETWAHLFALERTPSHLILTFRDGTTRGFVASNDDTWQCNTDRDGQKTSVTIRIQNLTGIQMIAETSDSSDSSV